jgi:hypothetical protein
VAAGPNYGGKITSKAMLQANNDKGVFLQLQTFLYKGKCKKKEKLHSIAAGGRHNGILPTSEITSGAQSLQQPVWSPSTQDSHSKLGTLEYPAA